MRGSQLNDRVKFVAVAAAMAFAFTQQALRLQQSETERRLHGLNNEAQRLQDAVAQNVSHDTWTAFSATYQKDTERSDQRYLRILGFQNRVLGALALAAIFIPIITGVAVYLLTRHGVAVQSPTVTVNSP